MREACFSYSANILVNYFIKYEMGRLRSEIRYYFGKYIKEELEDHQKKNIRFVLVGDNVVILNTLSLIRAGLSKNILANPLMFEKKLIGIALIDPATVLYYFDFKVKTLYAAIGAALKGIPNILDETNIKKLEGVFEF